MAPSGGLNGGEVGSLGRGPCVLLINMVQVLKYSLMESIFSLSSKSIIFFILTFVS